MLSNIFSNVELSETHFALRHKIFAVGLVLDPANPLSVALVVPMENIFSKWRIMRASNTEPLLRLNVESREISELVKPKVCEIEQILHSRSMIWEQSPLTQGDS